MRRQKLLAEVKANVLALDPAARVFLYGSRARGDHKRLSDWDFFVMTSYEFDRKKKDELQAKLYFVELESDQLIDSWIEFRANVERPDYIPPHQNLLKEMIEV